MMNAMIPVFATRAAPNTAGQGEFALSESDLPIFLLAFMVESLLFGIHGTLFFLCVRILFGRPRSRMKVAMLTAVMVMFSLAIVDVGISWYFGLRRTSLLYTGTTTSLKMGIQSKFVIQLINQAIADFLLLTRCYVVWGRRKVVLYIGGLGLITATICGVITAAAPKVPDLISVYILGILGLNFVLTAMTAGRIMWVAKEVKKALGPHMASYYHFSVGILVESGVLYTASTLLLVAFVKSIYWVVVAVIVLRVVGIVPILIIVQIAMGQSMEDVKTTVTRLQGTTQQIVLDTVISEGYGGEGEGVREPLVDQEMSQRRFSTTPSLSAQHP